MTNRDDRPMAGDPEAPLASPAMTTATPALPAAATPTASGGPDPEVTPDQLSLARRLRQPRTIVSIAVPLAIIVIFVALNGGPNFKFTEAVSFQIHCDTQDEIDFFWNALGKGGQEGPCGWLKDKYGLSWQVVPSVIPKMMSGPDAQKSDRVMNAVLKIKKLDLEKLTRAYQGQSA